MKKLSHQIQEMMISSDIFNSYCAALYIKCHRRPFVSGICKACYDNLEYELNIL